jgi:Domain of unknown function (DUF4268)
MASIISLGRLETVALREAWPHEAINFTPWLTQPENLALLADAVGMVLELEAVEKPVETFSADILARDVLTGRWVLIENQLESTDHSHLGQILTYAAGLDAETVIWIARDFREPHRAAIDYLNRISASEHNFFGVQVELLRIGTSAYAPRFNVVAKPNDWSKSIATKASANADTASRQSEWQTYWQAFFTHANEMGFTLPNRTAPKEGWCRTAQLKSGDPNASAWLHRANDRLRALIWMQGDRLQLFDSLLSKRDVIDGLVGLPVVWDRMDNKKSSMIYVERPFEGGTMSENDEYSWFVASIGKLTKVIQQNL